MSREYNSLHMPTERDSGTYGSNRVDRRPICGFRIGAYEYSFEDDGFSHGIWADEGASKRSYLVAALLTRYFR